MKRFISKKTVAIGLTAGLILGAGSAAFAFWTTTGSGTGSASTTSLSNVTLTGTVSTPLDLGATQTMSIEIDNSANTSAVTLNGETLSITAATCNGVSVPSTWFSGSTITQATEVAAGTDTVAAATASVTLNDLTGTNQNACQGQPVSLTLSAA